eukprot:319331_1
MAHQLLIGKGMITLNLKRIFLALTLLPLFAVAADDCALSDPTLTVQAYTVNPQTERVKMYWQKANGEAWGTLHALLADINSQGQVQMAMTAGNEHVRGLQKETEKSFARWHNDLEHQATWLES